MLLKEVGDLPRNDRKTAWLNGLYENMLSILSADIVLQLGIAWSYPDPENMKENSATLFTIK